MKSNALQNNASRVENNLLTSVGDEQSTYVLMDTVAEATFTHIYNSYYQSIYKLVRRMIADTAEAEDATQLCFIKVAKSMSDYDPAKGMLYTWIARIAVNTSLDILRSSYYTHRKSTSSITTEHIDGEILTVPDVSTDRIGLSKLLNNLTAKEKAIMELLYFKGYTQSETADKLNIPLGTVKTLSGTAIKKIRKLCANELTIK
jgi:RNA polymerase sigma-70 factor (ECF subfamily)